MSDRPTEQPRAEHPAARGPAPLEPRHIAVLTAIAIGLTADTAARHLGISDRTMRRHTAEAARLLGAHCTQHAVSLAILDGHINPGHIRNRTLPKDSHDGGTHE